MSVRLEKIVALIAARQSALQVAVFNRPPQSYEDFMKQQGHWLGLGEALRIISDARKEEENDD